MGGRFGGIDHKLPLWPFAIARRQVHDAGAGDFERIVKQERSLTASHQLAIDFDEYLRVDGLWLHEAMTLTTVFMSPVGEGWTKILA